MAAALAICTFVVLIIKKSIATDRKSFLKNTLLGAAASVAGSKLVVKSENSTYDKLAKETDFDDQVGYNHIPNKEIKTMKTVLHKANTRGMADHGWLNSRHTFSFANYRNPERMNFGVLRVLNDDIVAGGKGFGTHPHDNMEIISIPLEGDLQHKDSMGNVAVIKKGDVQVMSAGTGIYHSEYNKHEDQEVRFLQIWMFPNQKNVTPRYDQIALEETKMKNNLLQIVSPQADDDGVMVHQNSWWHMADLDTGVSLKYDLKDPQNGVYAFVLEGEVTIAGQSLEKRDGYGMWDTSSIGITADSNARILLMEVPMQLT